MVRDVEGISWLGLEALGAIPSHILDHQERTIRDENHVKSLPLLVHHTKHEAAYLLRVQ